MGEAVPARRLAPLHLLLSATNFAQGLGAFSVLGLLSAVAGDFAIPAHHAGWLMSVYALAYAFSSPLLIALFGHFDRKRVLLGGLALLATGAALASVGTGLPGVLLARALMAAGGGLITPVVGAMAVATSTPQLRGRALSTVFAGLPLAQVVGIPFATWVAGVSSWRWSFAAIACIALTALAAAAWKVPSGVRVQPVSLASLRGALSQGRVLLAVSFMVFFVGSNFTVLTYVGPLLVERYQVTPAQLATVLALYGLGAFLGNVVGGALSDRLGPSRTLAILCALTMLTLPVLTVFAVPLPLLVAALVLWAVFAWSVHPAQQARLSHLDPARAPILLSLHSSALYAGSWTGATLGGQVLAHGSSRWLGPAGALLTAMALLSLALVHWRAPAAA